MVSQGSRTESTNTSAKQLLIKRKSGGDDLRRNAFQPCLGAAKPLLSTGHVLIERASAHEQKRLLLYKLPCPPIVLGTQSFSPSNYSLPYSDIRSS